MRAALLIAFTVACPASILKSKAPVKEISSDSAGDDNSVFAAENAMRHQFAVESASAAPTMPATATMGNLTGTSAATSGGASASAVSQPKAVSWQAQRSQVMKSAVDEKVDLRAVQHREVGATTKHRAATGSEALRRPEAKGEQENIRFESTSAHSIFAFDSELATKGELAKREDDAHEHEADEQFVGDALRHSTADDTNGEFAKVDSELKVAAIELNSSKEALETSTRSLNATLINLRSERVRRTAAEKTSEAEAVSLKKMQAEASQQAAALTSMNMTIAKTAVELRATRTQLQTVVAAKASEAVHSAAVIRGELKDSRAESEELRQKLGRVVQMVQSDLADKDRQASELLDAEHARTEKVKRDLAGQQKELKELRTRSSELAEENYKLRARVGHPGDVYSSHVETTA